MQTNEQRCVVVACADGDDRASLIHILEQLSLDVVSCSDLDQVHEVLTHRKVLLVFCDQHHGEGWFRSPGWADNARQKASRVVVIIRTGDWDEYLQVMRLGAYDAVLCPFRPIDVEHVVECAMREDQESKLYRKTA